MGQFAERLVPEVKQRLGITGDEHDAEVLDSAKKAQANIELMTGYRLEAEAFRLHIDHGGLPFVATLGMQTDSLDASAECWPIPDAVNPVFANALQIGQLEKPPSRACPKAEALCAAAAVLAAVNRQGLLTIAPLLWFRKQQEAGPVSDWGRKLLDPGHFAQVPIAAGQFEGWWFQVSRRIFFVTKETPSGPGLVEVLAPPADGLALVASEPVLILARMTKQPSDCVFVARVWIVEGGIGTQRPWRAASQTVHRYGLPIVCIDDASTPEEVVAQTLLAAYWHGYIDGDETAPIPACLASAFPTQVARVMRGTGEASLEAAATLLFERLLRPGFDPSRGAGSIRRYIARHATTLVRVHRSALAASHPWDEFGIMERHYYKLLARLTGKCPDGRYEIDAEVKANLRAYLDRKRRRRSTLGLLRMRGFSDGAARKWLQRHDLAEIADAHPRRPTEAKNTGPSSR